MYNLVINKCVKAVVSELEARVALKGSEAQIQVIEVLQHECISRVPIPFARDPHDKGNMFRLNMFAIALFTSDVGFKHVSCMVA